MNRKYQVYIKNKNDKELRKDALRYRFLRSEESRPDMDGGVGTTRRLCVEVHDWGKNLGAKNMPFWASMELLGDAMDKEVDRQMKKVGWHE